MSPEVFQYYNISASENNQMSVNMTISYTLRKHIVISKMYTRFNFPLIDQEIPRSIGISPRYGSEKTDDLSALLLKRAVQQQEHHTQQTTRSIGQCTMILNHATPKKIKKNCDEVTVALEKINDERDQIIVKLISSSRNHAF